MKNTLTSLVIAGSLVLAGCSQQDLTNNNIESKQQNNQAIAFEVPDQYVSKTLYGHDLDNDGKIDILTWANKAYFIVEGYQNKARELNYNVGVDTRIMSPEMRFYVDESAKAQRAFAKEMIKPKKIIGKFY